MNALAIFVFFVSPEETPFHFLLFLSLTFPFFACCTGAMFKHKAVVLFTALLCLIHVVVASGTTFEDTMIPREVATLTAEMSSGHLDLSSSSGSELSAFVEESSGITLSSEPEKKAVATVEKSSDAAATNKAPTRRSRRGRGSRSNRRRRGARRGGKGRRGARRGRGRGRGGKARRGRKGGKRSRKLRRGGKGAKRSASRKGRKARKDGKRANRKGGKGRKAARKGRKASRKGGKGGKGRKGRKAPRRGGKRGARRSRGGKKAARKGAKKGQGKKKLTKSQAAIARFRRAAARMRQRRARRNAPLKPLQPFQGETYAPNGPIARLNKNKHHLDAVKPDTLVKSTAQLRKVLAKRRAELKRLREEQSNAAKRRAAAARAKFRRLRRVRRYRGSIRPGNFMKGGPISKPAHTARNWLQQYQERIVARQSGTDNNSVARRRAVLAKMADLYEKAKPTDISFLTEFIPLFGSTLTPDKIQQEWTAARNWLRQARLREAEKDKRETKLVNSVVTKKDRKEKEVTHSLPAIKRIFTKTDGAAFKSHLKVVEDLDDPLLARDFPDLDDGKTRKSNWWGCLDCESSSPSSKGKKRRASKRNPMARKRKGPSSSRGLGKAKGVNLPPIDLSINNEALIDHLLERMQLRRDPAMVKQRTKDVMDRLKTRIAEAMLTPEERNDLALAKVEALEKTVAYNSGAVNMVKRGELHHVKTRRNNWPSPNPPDAKEAENPDREVDIHFGMGYVRPPFRSDRESLDFASEDNEKAIDFHDDIKRQHNHYTKTVVWRQFEGKGDAEQQRAIKINAHRKKYPNQPLDGKMPW